MALEFISIFTRMTDNDNEHDDCPDEKALCCHHQSTFLYLYNSGNKHALLLNCCSVDHKQGLPRSPARSLPTGI
eukprot:jgi/Psemu1/24433/gm1.24433_g